MAFKDWIWLIKLIVEILKAIAELSDDEIKAIAKLRQIDEKVSA